MQNTVDAKVEDLYNKGTDGIKVEKNVGKIVENTGIGLLSNGAGELVGGGLKVATNSKYTKELKQVDRELNRSAKGSNGESTRMAKETQLNATIEGNKKVADAVGTVTTESLDAVFKK